MGRIGPNAILRLVEAVGERQGTDVALDLLHRAGLGAYAERPPQRMVDEAHVARLYLALVAALGATLAAEMGSDAGRRTGNYLLTHRIPQVAKRLLPWLPPFLASRALAGAIGRHAWTFAGSGRFAMRQGHPLDIAIIGGPVDLAGPAAFPLCRFYATTFERLYRALVSPRTVVTARLETTSGEPACRLKLRWR